MEVRRLVYYRLKNVKKNDNMIFKMFALIISVFRNNVAKLHLFSLHRSGEINNNVLKLLLLLDLQDIRCRSAATLETVTE
jgi:ABC-type methionine transport system ATPase subunit